MKSLPLQNASFRFIEQSFKEWLDIQGFADTTVYNLPTHIRELLHYLESQGINHIKELEIKHIYAHYEKLKERTHQRRSGGLSNGHLNKHIQALRKFTDYLRKVGRIQLPALNLDNEEENHKITFLTEEEIKELFAATEKRPERVQVSEVTLLAMQARDRAMLAVYYGCGLRRNEGVHLDLSDINFDKSILHVRKGKNYKERFVPISKTSIRYLQEYIYDHRSQLVKSSTIDALFLSQRGLRMQGQSLFIRLKLLQQRSGNLNLLEKEIGLHTLRHSIATHLMAAGMRIESISKFLGHNSLESTQIYTHLAGVETERKQDYPNIPKYETTQLSEDERG
jgi:integrase/recombinase XerD